MREADRAYLADVRDALQVMVDGHDVCFEHNSDDCKFDMLQEVVEMLDHIVVETAQWEFDGAAYRKQLLEQAAADQ